MTRTIRLTVAALGLTLATSVRADDWPQFRGPNATGVAGSDQPLPTKFSHTDNVVWSAKIGDGIGCPIVHSGKAYVTAMTGPEQFTVFAFDAASGKELWRRDLATGKLPKIIPPNSHASSTPATDGQRVYAYFSTIGLVGLDAADGKELWRLPLPRPIYLMEWGAGVSPIVHDGTVIFAQDDDLQPYMVGVDAATGTHKWKTDRPEMLAGYSVPVLCTADGRTDVVVAGTGKLKGYDPATGKELWTCNTMLRTVMTTPAVHDGIIYISVQSYGDSSRLLKHALLDWLDTNQDGKLARSEVPPEFHEKFDASDKNKDGFLEGDEELDTAFQAPTNMVGGGNTVQAIRGGGRGDVTETHVLWNDTKTRAPSNLSSPLWYDGNLYTVKKGGLTSCFDAATGKPHWELKRLRSLGDYYASPVAGDGKVYIIGENGFVNVLKAGPTMDVLSRNDMGAPIHATPAIADGRIYLRTRETLYCVGNGGS